MKLPIYLDAQATTPLDPRVLDEMLPALRETFGNPSSAGHRYGIEAQNLVETARARIAKLIRANPEELIFTSGATEATNLALKGVAEVYGARGKHFITQVTEHKSVLEVFKFLEKQGFEVTYLPVDSKGLIDLEELEAGIHDQTILISVMSANNETGAVQPISEIGAMAKKHKVLFHTDAAQSIGRLAMHVDEQNIDLMSLSAHKSYGPKGVGALYVRKENPHVRLKPQIHGGGQETGLRSGTLNTAGVSGFGEACRIIDEDGGAEAVRLSAMAQKFADKLVSKLDGITVNGDRKNRLPGNMNISFSGIEGNVLLKALSDELAVSSGSACMRETGEPSYVLKAMGVPEELIHTSIRFGFGRFNTDEELTFAVNKIVREVSRLREISPFKSLQ